MSLILKSGREKSVLMRHQWIFSGAVKRIPEEAENGSYVSVVSSAGEFLAKAFLNRRSSIVARIVCFQDICLDLALREHIKNAVLLRKSIFGSFSGKMLRLINAEADMLSGLIVDLYDTVCVIQISALGMERNKDVIVDELNKQLSLTWIYEKSTSPSRKHEGLPIFEGTYFGKEQNRVIAEEEGIRFFVDVKEGQKTGFFLDQREMRRMVRRISSGKKVLNCFSYTGGFSLAALVGGASFCVSIDSSQPALSLIDENLQLNGISSENLHQSICTDVFSWLEKEALPFDIIILDPPAFAKRKQDLESALRGYREINRRALQKMPKGSFLITSSCSYHVQPTQFLAMLKKAALDADRNVRLLSHHQHAWDHPTSLYHPETEYLKSAVLYVE